MRVKYRISYSGGVVGGTPEEADLSWMQSSGEHLADFTRRYWKRDSVIDMEKPKDAQRPPRGWNLIVAHNHGGYQQYSAFESDQPASRERRILSNNTGVTNDDGRFERTTEEEHPTRFMIQNCWLGFQEGARPLSYQLAKAIETGTAAIEDEPVKMDGRETIKMNLQIPPRFDADVFLDPARGYNMVHADIRLLGPNNSVFAQIHDVTLSSITPTVWLPTVATYSAQPDGQGKLTVHKQFFMEYTAVNEQVERSEFVIEYPPGTHIVDHATGSRLRIPKTGEDVRATAQEIYANPPPEAFVGSRLAATHAATGWIIAALVATFGFFAAALGVYWRRRKSRSAIDHTCLVLFASFLWCCDSKVSSADQEQQTLVNLGGKTAWKEHLEKNSLVEFDDQDECGPVACFIATARLAGVDVAQQLADNVRANPGLKGPCSLKELADLLEAVGLFAQPILLKNTDQLPKLLRCSREPLVAILRCGDGGPDGHFVVAFAAEGDRVFFRDLNKGWWSDRAEYGPPLAAGGNFCLVTGLSGRANKDFESFLRQATFVGFLRISLIVLSTICGLVAVFAGMRSRFGSAVSVRPVPQSVSSTLNCRRTRIPGAIFGFCLVLGVASVVKVGLNGRAHQLSTEASLFPFAVSEVKHDFGILKEKVGEIATLKNVFRVTNKSREPIRVTKLVADCNCIKSDDWEGTELIPGDERELSLNWSLRIDQPGTLYHQKLSLFGFWKNEPVNLRFELSASSEGEPQALHISPRYIDLGTFGREGSSILNRKMIVIRSLSESQIGIVVWEVDSSKVVVTRTQPPKDWEPESDGQEATFLSLDPMSDLPDGFYVTNLSIIRGEVRQNVEVSFAMRAALAVGSAGGPAEFN